MSPFRIAFLAFVAVTAVSAARAEDTKDDFKIPRISVEGAAHEDVKPDRALLTLGVVSEKPTAALAAAENAKLATAAVAEMKRLGIAAADIKTLSVTLDPVMIEDRDPKTNQILKRTLTGYRATNSIGVTLRDVDRAGAIVSQIVESGANTYRNVQFEVSDAEARLDSLREQAIREARRRATIYARGAAMKLGRLMAIDPNPEPSGYADLPARKVAAGPVTVVLPIEPGVERIGARVTAVWELVPE